MKAREWQRAGALRMLRVLGIGALAVTAGVIALVAVLAWSLLVDRAENRALKNAALIEAYVLRLVQTQEVALAAADEALSLLAPADEEDDSPHLFLRRLSGQIGGSVGIAFVRGDGAFLLSSTQHPATGNVGEREYLKDTPKDGVFVDRLVVQPQGIEALIVARRPADRLAPDGVWISAVEIGTIRAFLQRVAAGGGEAASVLRDDGRLLVRNLPMEAQVTLDAGQPLMRTIAERGGGIYRARAQTDAAYRYYAATKVGDLPLYASFGVARAAVVREWLTVMAVAVAGFGALGGSAFLLARTAARSLRAEAAQAELAFDRRLLAEAEKTAAVKEAMLRELNHRVKNSLAMITALIRLQRGKPDGPDLDEVGARVVAIATIHDLLYQASGDFEVDFAELLRRIGASEAVVPPEGGVRVAVHAEPLELDASVATPLALCVVELVTNAAKHAYGPEGGRIDIELGRLDGGRARLVVADEGRGMADLGGRHSGLRVVDELVRQIGGEIRRETGAGTRFTIDFPVGAAQDRIAAELAAS